MPVNEAPEVVVEAAETSRLAIFSSDVGVYGQLLGTKTRKRAGKYGKYGKYGHLRSI